MIFQIDICKPNSNTDWRFRAFTYLFLHYWVDYLQWVVYLLTFVSSPCRHVTCLYLLCCITQTRVRFIYILLNWVLALVCMLTHPHPHTVTYVVTHTPQATQRHPHTVTHRH